MNKVAIRSILVVLIFIIFITIFSFSSQIGPKSKGISSKVAEFIINIKEDTSKLGLKEKEKLIEDYQPLIRKGAHFSIYTILGIVTMAFMFTFEMNNKKRALITLILGVIYASSDEIHQIFVPERTAKVTDVLIDSCGIVIGIVIVMGISVIFTKISNINKHEMT